MDSSKVLPKGRMLKGAYKIEKVLGAGGFGITYLARRRIGNIKVSYAVKEYFISSICSRSGDDVWVSNVNKEQFELGKAAFISQANRISKNHIFFNNIVAVDEVFEQNETAYYVMELVEGDTLTDYVDKRGGLDVESAMTIFVPMLQAVNLLHSNYILHLDIKPDNVIVGRDNADNRLRPVIIDFDLSKHYGFDGNVSSMLPFISCSEGYAPREQYEVNGVSRFLPQADIYALGATLLFMLTGQGPTISSAFDREQIPSLLSPDTPGHIGRAIYNAMAPSVADRTPTVAQMAADFGLDTRNWPSAVMRDPDSFGPQLSRKKSGGSLIGVLCCLCAVLAGIVAYLAFREKPCAVEAFGHEICFVPVPIDGDTIYMAETVVTQKLWNAAMGENSHYFSFMGDNKPAMNLTPNDCEQFIEALNKETGLKFRLPTSKEWMHAYREGNEQMDYKFPGSDNPKKVGWLMVKNPQDVGDKKENALGLHDMLGNIAEMTKDPMDQNASKVSKISRWANRLPADDYYVCGLYCRSKADSVQPRIEYTDIYKDDERLKFVGLRLVCDENPTK